MQSGVLDGGFQWLAVDGNYDTNYDAGSCMKSHKTKYGMAWWAVKVGEGLAVKIGSVAVTHAQNYDGE